MLTYKGSGLIPFNTSNISDADLGLSTSTACGTAVSPAKSCTSVVGFYRGEDAYNPENWKLGDLFHTNPMAVKTPTQYFYDPRQCGATSFAAFRNTDSNIRTAANTRQLMLAGSNDGQLHAFRTGDGSNYASGGDEVWSFIPPNLLQKLSPVAHSGHTDRSGLAAHSFFIDGPIQVADVWLPGTEGTGASKNASDWKTIAVVGEGQGSGGYLWSSSPSCYSTSTTGFSATYADSHPYYCGFYALDVTTSSAGSPTYLWHLKGAGSTDGAMTAAQGTYLGEAWSKMQIGRVKIGSNEKWVGFIGGGLSGTGSAGKGFFVVDMKDGTILKSFTNANTSYMNFAAPASPLPLDVDGDGFIDTVYMGDLGGNMWRFRLCPKVATESCCPSSVTCSYSSLCGTGNWTASRLYAASDVERGSGLSTPSNTHKQIFSKATATKDTAGNWWVYFGTGENNDPTYKPTTAIPDTTDTKNRLYAIKEDPDFTATRTTANLKDITSSTSTYCTAVVTGCTAENVTTDAAKNGWYINLSTNSLTAPSPTGTINSPLGEKMISDPMVFGGIVYFPTYVPDQGGSSACGLAGNAFLYGINYLSGNGTFGDSYSRTKWIGQGIGSSILVSFRPGNTIADIYATASGGAGTPTLTQQVSETKKTNPTNIIYWKDRRLE